MDNRDVKTHLDEETAAAVAEGRIPPPPHAVDCPACRRLILSLGVALAENGRWTWSWRDRLPRFAAAAAILLAVAVWRFPREETPVSPPAPSPTPGPGPVAGKATEPDRVLAFGRTGSLVVRAGSRLDLERAAEGRISFKSGALALCVRTGEGERPAEIACGTGRVTVITIQDADLVLESAPRPGRGLAALFLPAAHAEEADASRLFRLSILKGSARVSTPGGQVEVTAGRCLDIHPGPDAPGLPRDGGPSWSGGQDGWQSLEAARGVFRDGVRALTPPEPVDTTGTQDMALEVLVVRLTPAATLEFRFRAGGRGWALPLGENLAGRAGQPLRIVLLRQAGRVRLDVGGLTVLDEPDSAASLTGRVQPGAPGETGCSLKAWGGDIEILEVRLRTMSR